MGPRMFIKFNLQKSQLLNQSINQMDLDDQPPLINWAAYAADTERFNEYVPPSHQCMQYVPPPPTTTNRKRPVDFALADTSAITTNTQNPLVVGARSGARPCQWCGRSCERMISNGPVGQIQQRLYDQLKNREFGHYECLFSACSDMIEYGRDDVRERLRALLGRYTGGNQDLIFYVPQRHND